MRGKFSRFARNVGRSNIVGAVVAVASLGFATEAAAQLAVIAPKISTFSTDFIKILQAAGAGGIGLAGALTWLGKMDAGTAVKIAGGGAVIGGAGTIAQAFMT